jgi:RNA polymerase sigma-70 factor (ECF subfamily)
MRLFADHHREVFAYIMALVGDEQQAEECFQDVSVTLWRRCADFDPSRPGSSFMAWAKTVALNQVRNWRRTQRRDRLVFSDATVQQLADEHGESDSAAAEARAALRGCMTKLREADRDLVERCYAEGATFARVAVQTGRPVNTVYKALNRIRRALLECIRRRLEADGGGA